MQLLHKFDEGFEVYFTSSDDGDARELVESGDISRVLTDICGRPVELLRLNQIHSDIVYESGEVLSLGQAGIPEGDAIVSKSPNVSLGVFVADCAPVALVSNEGVFAAAHCGWKGLRAGILENTVNAMVEGGATNISAFVGPCIKSDCYEFDGPNLNEFKALLGQEVVATTAWGTPSLDMVAAIEKTLRSCGVERVSSSADCTGCDAGYFSYRLRRSSQRHLMAVVPAGVMT